MTQPPTVGPVEIVVLSFPGIRIEPEVTAAFTDVLGRGYVTVLDLIYLAKNQDGQVTLIEADESLAETGLDALTVSPLGLVSENDLDIVRSSMAPGTAAVVIVYEQTWARTLAEEVRSTGGAVELHIQVPRDVVEAALIAT
ncbi:MAG: DUF1269 domain-containing protein [Rhodococcus sp.]|nr:DUF1269 domain-containing protein [Rhodococcus sp. (in: high G+C Gram-positive bacteria)]